LVAPFSSLVAPATTTTPPPPPLQVAIVREASPFQREATNVLLVLSQYQILLTFLSAFVVASGTLATIEGDNPLALGVVLCVVNAAILLVAALLVWARYGARTQASLMVSLGILVAHCASFSFHSTPCGFAFDLCCVCVCGRVFFFKK
jgi:hypothetical protein